MAKILGESGSHTKKRPETINLIRSEAIESIIKIVDPVTSFISYSRTDADFVLRLCQDLRAAGRSIWLDKLDIRPGEDWDESIARALAECGRMVIVLSPTSSSLG